MNVRTVINELVCTSWRAMSADLLAAECAIVLTTNPLLAGQDSEHVLQPTGRLALSPQVRPLVLVSFEELGNWATVAGLTKQEAQDAIVLVYTGRRIAPAMQAPANAILIARPGTYQALCNDMAEIPAKAAQYEHIREKLFLDWMASYDVNQFAACFFEALKNPVVITNADRRILAVAGNFPHGRLEERYQNADATCELELDGVIASLRHSKYAVLSADAETREIWANSIMYFHHQEMGRFDVLELNRPIGGFDLELIDYAASLMAVMLDRLGAAGERAGAGSSVLSELVAGNFTNEKALQARLAMTHLPAEESYVMALVEGANGADARYYRRIATVVARTIPKCLWTHEEKGVAFIVPIGASTEYGYDDYQRAEARLNANEQLHQMLETHDLKFYISEPFVNITLAHDRFMECLDLRRAMRSTHDVRLVYFWQRRFQTIASVAQGSNHIDMLLDKRVVAMAAYDHKHATEYLATAIMSVRFPGSPAEAAEALNIHRNTYFYRLQKVREQFFLDVKDGDDRLALAFSAALLQGLENVNNLRIESALMGNTEL